MPRKGRQPGATMLQPTKETFRNNSRAWETEARDLRKKLGRAEAKLKKLEGVLLDALTIIQDQPAPVLPAKNAWGRKSPRGAATS